MKNKILLIVLFLSSQWLMAQNTQQPKGQLLSNIWNHFETDAKWQPNRKVKDIFNDIKSLEQSNWTRNALPSASDFICTTQFTLPKDENRLLENDLFVLSENDVQINGNIIGKAIADNHSGQNLVVLSFGTIVVNGDIELSNGGNGIQKWSDDVLSTQSFTSTPSVGNSVSMPKIPILSSNFLGGDGGSLVMIAKRIIINGNVKIGHGGNGYNGSNGGDGGSFFLISQTPTYSLTHQLDISSGDGGEGGNGGLVKVNGGNGGRGGDAVFYNSLKFEKSSVSDSFYKVKGILADCPQPDGTGNVTGASGTNGIDGNDNSICNTGGTGGGAGNGNSGGQARGCDGALGFNAGNAVGGSGGGGGGGGGGSQGPGCGCNVGFGGNGGSGGYGGHAFGGNGANNFNGGDGGGGGSAAGGEGGGGGHGGNGGGGGGVGGVGGSGGNGTGGNGGYGNLSGGNVTISGGRPGGSGGFKKDCFGTVLRQEPNGTNGGNGSGMGGEGGNGIYCGAPGGSGGKVYYAGTIVGSGSNGRIGTICTMPGQTCQDGSCVTVIPIELMFFEAKLKNQSIILIWQTATEVNISHYDIERSTDGKTFDKIGETKAKGKAATYEFLDRTPLSTTMYYRLKINDLDGKTDYSKIISLPHQQKVLSVKTFPNPFGDNITVSITTAQKSDLIIVLTDILGRSVYQWKAKNTEGALILPVSTVNLPSGTYFLKVSDGQSALLRKIVKN